LFKDEVPATNKKSHDGLSLDNSPLRPTPCFITSSVLILKMVQNASPKDDGSFEAVREGLSIRYAKFFGQGAKKPRLLKCAPGDTGPAFYCDLPPVAATRLVRAS